MFDAPNAGDGWGLGTIAYAINTAGSVTGTAADNSHVYHGFVRLSAGKITGFDAPGAGGGSREGTLPAAINDTGVIAGTLIDSAGASHGFIRK